MGALSWAALALVCAGEEVSWGQRILGFAGPEELVTGNRQGEFNIHNHIVLEELIGRHGWRAISVLIFMTGVVLPLLTQTAAVRRLFQVTGLPVAPLAYLPLFVASYLFAKLMFEAGHLNKPAEELRELLFAAGMFAFALHGALRPHDLLRVRN